MPPEDVRASTARATARTARRDRGDDEGDGKDGRERQRQKQRGISRPIEPREHRARARFEPRARSTTRCVIRVVRARVLDVGVGHDARQWRETRRRGIANTQAVIVNRRLAARASGDGERWRASANR